MILQPPLSPLIENAAGFARDQIAAESRLSGHALAVDKRKCQSVFIGLDD
jgi:hypothetical protein